MLTVLVGIALYLAFAYGLSYLFDKANDMFLEMIPDSIESKNDDI